MKDDSCETCRFFFRIEQAVGECRRTPPSITDELLPATCNAGTYYLSHWPRLFDDSWCGEFQPRPKQPPATDDFSPKTSASDILISDLNLSTRARNALVSEIENKRIWRYGHRKTLRAGCPLSVWTLEQLTVRELRLFRNMGDKTVAEIVAELARVGTSLAMEDN